MVMRGSAGGMAEVSRLELEPRGAIAPVEVLDREEGIAVGERAREQRGDVRDERQLLDARERLPAKVTTQTRGELAAARTRTEDEEHVRVAEQTRLVHDTAQHEVFDLEAGLLAKLAARGLRDALAGLDVPADPVPAAGEAVALRAAAEQQHVALVHGEGQGHESRDVALGGAHRGGLGVGAPGRDVSGVAGVPDGGGPGAPGRVVGAGFGDGVEPWKRPTSARPSARSSERPSSRATLGATSVCRITGMRIPCRMPRPQAAKPGSRA